MPAPSWASRRSSNGSGSNGSGSSSAVAIVVILASLLVSLLPSGLAATRCASTSALRQRSALAAAFLTRSTPGSMQRVPTPSRSLGICHTFAGLALDRSRTAVELKEAAAFEQALKLPGSSFVLFHGTSALVEHPAAGAGGPTVAYHTAPELAARLGVSIENLLPRPPSAPGVTKTEEAAVATAASASLTCVALGAGAASKQEAAADPRWVFAVDVSARPKEEVEARCAAAAAGSRVVFEPVRGLMATMAGAELAVCGQGAALLAWHRLNQYCGVCGSPMVAVEAGGRRACTSTGCRNRAYPRIDPVCIALVYDPATDRCLLGRQRVYRPGMFSCLAGYAEQCESLEEAVRREVKEESGVDVGKVVFHSSQPWPIGRGASCQLMVGFICEATSVEIDMDGEELEDVRWFSREEVSSAKELVVTPLSTATANGQQHQQQDDGALSIPGPYAIAHHLIRHWLQTPPRHRL